MKIGVEAEGDRPSIWAAGSGPVDLDWDGYRRASHLVVGALAALTIAAVLSVGASAALLPLGLGFAAAIVLSVQAVWMPSLFNLVFVLAVLVDGAGFAWGLYEAIVPYDELAHGLTAMAVTLAVGFHVYRPLADGASARIAPFLLALFTLGVAVGSAWEVFEWLVGIEMSLHDTITDLVADAIGAAAALPFAYAASRQRFGSGRATASPRSGRGLIVRRWTRRPPGARRLR